MRSALQLLGGIAVAGVVAAGSTALTGSGLSFLGTGTGKPSQFVGGAVTQSITGAVLNSIDYLYVANTGQTEVNKMTIGLSGTGGRHFAVTTLAGGGTDNGYGGSATQWSCDETPNLAVTASITALSGAAGTDNTVVCQPSDGTSTLGYYTNLGSVTVTIS